MSSGVGTDIRSCKHWWTQEENS